MDLKIAGRRAIVCAASKGLGRGCAEALPSSGLHDGYHHGRRHVQALRRREAC